MNERALDQKERKIKMHVHENPRISRLATVTESGLENN